MIDFGRISSGVLNMTKKENEELKTYFDENGDIFTNEKEDTFKADYGKLGEEEYYKMLKHGLEYFNYYDEPTVIDTNITWQDEKMYKVCYKGYTEIGPLSSIQKITKRMLNYD